MGQEVEWVVGSVSSESEVHSAVNVLGRDLDKPWLTERPTDDAWLVLEPRPPTAFNRVEVVNAGSAVLEIHGLREDVEGDDVDGDYELLLSAQQVMSVKDLIRKSNRNQAFTYDIEGTHKLASVAAQQRWRKIRVSCRQPLGTSEHRASIGLAYINFTSCHCESKPSNLTQYHNNQNLKPKPAVINTKRKLPSWLSTSEPKTAEEVPEKKPRSSYDQDMDVKVIDSDVEEARKNTSGAEVTQPEQSGSCNLEHVQSEARVADNDDTEDKPISGLKKRSPATKETGGKQTKRAKSDKGSHIDGQSQPIKLFGTSQNEDNELDRDHVKRKSDKEKLVQGGSSQRKLPLSREGKGKASREENQVLRDVHPGSKNGSEREFSKLLEGVVFTISGIQNPERGQLRSKGLEMGAQYLPDWSTDCTLLVCAYMDTPKFKQVQADGGSIVSKDWILECYKKHKLVDFERFVLNKGRPWRLSDIVLKRKKVNCGSEEEIRKWAQEDLTSIIYWLQQQDTKPEPEELEFTAAQGILVCLEDAVKSLTENRGLSSIIENWGFLPRAVKELAAIEEGEGGCTTTSRSTLQEAERLKGIYEESLKEFLSSSRKLTNLIDEKKTLRNGEGEVDDDATEVMSDVDSQETVDYDSDDTTVMDSKTIEECTKNLMERFANKVK
ncbi:hypothetical protein M758_7G122400 [Ceratodon purpureus]|nr:hypothetical protein M758_7G122400 [Ceratodon purpureus]